ncbi:MAG: TonB-dependent receptor plug domain-containing protein [Nitrospiraceae bacterium]
MREGDLPPRTTSPAMPRLMIVAGVHILMLLAPPAPAPAASQATDRGDGVSGVFSFIEEETVSTAIRREQPISQAPSNVYVITAEDIRQSGSPDVPTVLRRIPGLEVMQITGAEFNVSARGNNQLLANKMLVLVDGRSVYIDMQGFVFWKGLPVTLPEIKQIEVIKGPISALYGFNAFDGVVNIITKSPEEMKGTTLQIAGGELGTALTSAIHAGVQGKLRYRVSGGYEQNVQWRDHDALAFRSYKFNGQTEYAFSGPSKLSVSGGLVYMDPHDGPLVGFGSTLVQPTTKLPYLNVAYENQGFFLRAYWNGFFADSNALAHPLLTGFVQTTDPSMNSHLTFSGNTYNVEGQHSLKVGESARFTYGINYRHNTFGCNCLSTFGKENRLGLYIQGEWSVTPSISVVGGVRYDLHTQINPTFSPRLAVLYTPVPGHTLRAQASVAYRPPTLFETYEDARFVPLVPNPFFPVTNPVLGSRNLDPEEILSYELGYQGWFYRHRLRVRADFFFNRISDLIGLQSSGNIVNTVNTGRTEIYGAEVGIEFQATPWLTGFANYSYQKIGQNFTGLARRGAPQSKVNAGLRGEWENGLSGEAVLHYVGPASYPFAQSFDIFGVSPGNRVGGYSLVNLRAGYRFWEQEVTAGYRRSAEAAISVFNALGDDHKEHPLGELIERRVMAWLTLKL